MMRDYLKPGDTFESAWGAAPGDVFDPSVAPSVVGQTPRLSVPDGSFYDTRITAARVEGGTLFVTMLITSERQMPADATPEPGEGRLDA